MIRALMWKEYREHRAIWLTLALVGGAGLYGLSCLMGPVWGLNYNSARETLRSVAVLFAWAYGLTCGAMLLANERESGTLIFLDMLPMRRMELWLVKSLFGLLLFLAQVVVLTGFVVGLGITETTGQLRVTLLAMLFFGLLAMSWSLLFSANGENVLNVIGLSFLGQIGGVLLTLLLLLPVAVVLELVWRGDGKAHKIVLMCLGTLMLTLPPVLGSARLFSRLDRQRDRTGGSTFRRLGEISVWTSWGRLLWLSYTQMRRLLVGVMLFALLLGFVLPVLGPMAWPALTLLFGVLCGVTVWSDEQLSASFRFLGDQRFPLGRVWIVKVGTRFVLAVLAAFVLLLPSLVRAAIHGVEGGLADERVPFFGDLLHCSLIGPIVPVWTHLSLWLLYGFTVGHLCGLLFRKSLVAGVVALGMAGMLVCLWVPSLLGMGLHFWQVAGVPLALLAAGWLLMPAWAADRLLAPDTFARLGMALLLAGLWTAGGLWYRVAEIPDVPDQFDMPAFVAGIPPMDKGKNDAGLAIHSAWSQVSSLSRELYKKRDGEPLFPDLRRGDNQDTFAREIDAALSRGWPANRPAELDQWLDEKFQQEWYKRVTEAADHPLGAVENLKQMTIVDRLHEWGNLTHLNKVLAVRGLQQQARGDHRAFVDNLRIGLALSRNLQHRAPPIVVRIGWQAELIGVAASLDHWLENLPPGHAELLERVRDILLEHEAQRPDERDANKAAYLIAQNSLDMLPNKLIERQLDEAAREEKAYHSDPDRKELRQAEINAAAMFWRVPWEHQRHQRILRLAFQGDAAQQRQAQKWGGAALMELVPRLRPRSKRDLALLHVAQLKVAVRLYQAKNQGRLPATANELAPRYLPALPIDPFDGKPLRYRISKGENLVWFDDAPVLVRPPAPPGMPAGMAGAPAGQPGGMPAIPPLPPPPPIKDVPAGQAILWSVGEDGRDGGGRQQGLHVATTSFGQDLIYLVPPPR